VLGVLMLSGCSAAGVSAEPVEVAASVKQTPVPTAEPSASAPVAVIADEAPTSAPSGAAPEGEATLLKALHGDGVLVGLDGVSDADLLAAANYACTLFEQGQSYDQMDVISGDEAYLASEGMAANRNDRDIAGIASQTLCLEYNIAG